MSIWLIVEPARKDSSGVKAKLASPDMVPSAVGLVSCPAFRWPRQRRRRKWHCRRHLRRRCRWCTDRAGRPGPGRQSRPRRRSSRRSRSNHRESGSRPLVERSLLGHALLDSSHHLAAGVDDGDGHVRRPCQAVVNGGRLVGHPGITGEDVRFRTRSTEEPQETAASDWRWSPSAGWGRSRTGLHPGDR